MSKPTARIANSYRPVSNLMTKTYQPQGSTQAPAKVPQLVSGVAPAARPAQSAGSSTTGQNGGKK